LIAPDRGSWFVLGEIFTTLPLPEDALVPDRCGSCRRCIDACPTGAIVEPYVLDARRCLSYWNIEHRGPIEERIGALMGNWIFGCDLCQDVCPHNIARSAPGNVALKPRTENLGRSLGAWADLSVEEYRERFRASAVKRARYDGLMRNIAIARANARG
jgi:epoxyqueuosine reductase